MSKCISSFLICMALISQLTITDVCGMANGIEFTTAALRAPAVILTKKAEQDKKFKKAYLLGATANFIRLTSDIFALYNLFQKNDDNYYKWTNVMWIGQDFTSLLVKVKTITSTDSDKWKKVEVDGEKKIDLMLSDFLKKLDIYILPSIEGAAATGLCLANLQEDFSSRLLTFCLQTVISGSRLLSDMIEAESGSMEQKIVIASTIIHAVALFVDLIKPTKPRHFAQAEIATVSVTKEPDLVSLAVLQLQPVVDPKPVIESEPAHEEDATPILVAEPVAAPVVEHEPIARRTRSASASAPVPANLRYIRDGDLGLVQTPDGIRSARVGLMTRKDYAEYKRTGIFKNVPRHDD